MTDRPVPLTDAFASPETKQRYVRRLFSTIADRYDLITVLLSFGLDRRWKRRVVDLAAPTRGQRALDLACGTGDLAFALATRSAAVVGLDVTFRMIELARAKLRGPATDSGTLAGAGSGRCGFLVGDMCSVPFTDGQFDIVTTGYGLRNVPDLTKAIAEIHRVLRPGGVLVSLDFNRPSNRFVRATYLGYLAVTGSALGWLLHRDPDTYRYIPESIRRYPGAAGVAELMRSAGFGHVKRLPVLGGLMAIHVARRSA
ncbi:MAG: ubiquinone/menaquinone biosynthesis methyltransferase [Acidobacteria bacterium]|nr:ubiquinone/menaquinone biosynthesis methyltransferase [Acidobacteriota bacterium]